MEGFLRYWFGGLIFGGAYRGLSLLYFVNDRRPFCTCFSKLTWKYR